MASSASRIYLLAIALPLLLAVAAPDVDAWGGRMFFSKMTRPEAVAEADKAADTRTTAAVASTEALDANSAPAAFSRPSSNRGYGLYGRPEEDDKYPPAYYRRGVHRDAEKLTTTNTNVAPRHEEAAVVVPAREESSGEDEPVFPEDGSGRGRPLSYMRGGGKGKRDYGMSDTRLYQNGRYYYDVETDKYGYGYESNPVRTTARPEPEDNGSGYGRPGKHRRYGDAAGYENGGEEFDNGAAEKQNNDDDGFQENHNGQYNNP